MNRLIVASIGMSLLVSCQAPKQSAKHGPHVDQAAHAGDPVKPEEPVVAGSGTTSMQDEMARAALAFWQSLTPEQRARAATDFGDAERQRWTYLPKIEQAGLDNVHFAWAGGIAPGERHYYRILGPTFLIEYDNTQNSGNHIHSVWRDPTNDFGLDLLKRHYQEHPHGGGITSGGLDVSPPLP